MEAVRSASFSHLAYRVTAAVATAASREDRRNGRRGHRTGITLTVRSRNRTTEEVLLLFPPSYSISLSFPVPISGRWLYRVFSSEARDSSAHRLYNRFLQLQPLGSRDPPAGTKSAGSLCLRHRQSWPESVSCTSLTLLDSETGRRDGEHSAEAYLCLSSRDELESPKRSIFTTTRIRSSPFA